MRKRREATTATLCALVLYCAFFGAAPLAAQEAAGDTSPYGYEEPAYAPGPDAATGAEPAPMPGQDGPPPPPPGEKPPTSVNPLPMGPDDIQALAKRAVEIQQTCLQTQGRILELQDKVTNTLVEQEGDPSDVTELQQLRTMHRQLRIMRRVAARIMKRLKAGGKIPPGQARLLGKLEKIFRERMGPLKEGLSKIKGLLGPDQAGVLENTDILDENKKKTSLEGKLPEQMREAAERMVEGDIKEPRNLLEVFIRIPEDETPKGSIEEYKEMQKRKK